MTSALRILLRTELTIGPGRLASIIRISVSCALVVFIAMLYSVPEPAYSAYIVFFLGRGDRSLTLMTGIVAALAATLATLLSLFLYTLDAGEPALRLPLMAASTFLGMFLLRTISLGPVAFVAGFLLTVTQSIRDNFPDTETLIRFVMWLWVVVLLPDVVTVLVNLLTAENPLLLVRRKSLHLLEELAGAIRASDRDGPAAARGETLQLLELRAHAGLFDKNLKALGRFDTGLIEIVAELQSVAGLLPADLDPATRESLAAACDSCREALRIDAPFPALAIPPDAPAPVLAMAAALNRLGAGLDQRRRGEVPPPPSAAKTFFVPDAFTNPDHLRFATKTTIAAMSAYILYTALDWPGIRTSLITCFFVALGTVGETVHKLTLRISGAVLGGLIGGLCIVYVLPHMEDIGQLCLLVAAVAALCAWVGTSSERLAYCGLQMAMAFFLGVLQGYGPSDDLTILRDRVAGIVLGNVLMSLVFTTLWPVSSRAMARKILADALNKLGAALSAGQAAAGLRLAAVSSILRAGQLFSLSFFETGAQEAAEDRRALAEADGLAAQAFVQLNQPADPEAGARLTRYAASLLGCLMLLFAASARAEDPGGFAPHVERVGNAVEIEAGKSYRLDELIDLAERSNPETRGAWERARQAAFAVGLTESTYLPEIAAEALAGYQRTPLPIPKYLVERGYFTAETLEVLPTLSVKWLLFDFGRRDNALEGAKANEFVAHVGFNGANQKLVFTVSRDYFSLDAMFGKLRVAEQALKNAGVVQDAVESRRRQGLATSVELAQAQRQSAQARYDLERAGGAQRAAYQALVAAMGVSPSKPIAVAGSGGMDLPVLPGEAVELLVERALSARPDLIAAEGKIRAADANLRKEEADDYPIVALDAQGYQNIGEVKVDGSPYYSVNQPGANVMLKFSWSLYDGGAREKRAAIARSEAAAARDALDQARDEAVRQVTTAYDALKTGLAEHQAAIALKAAAQAAYDAGLDSYRHGVGTYTALVQDETALTQAQSAFEDARANTLSAAVSLAYATGSISFRSREP